MYASTLTLTPETPPTFVTETSTTMTIRKGNIEIELPYSLTIIRELLTLN